MKGHGGRAIAMVASALILPLAWVGWPAVVVAAPPPSPSASPSPSAAPTGQACDPKVPFYLPNPPTAIAQLGMESAWEYSTGKGVRVAVVDSGVDAGNAHLAVNGKDHPVAAGVNLVADTTDTTDTTDIYAHGTAIAGLIAARAVKDSGLIGLAPEATIVPVRVYAGGGSGGQSDDPQVPADVLAQGITWAADHKAQIIVVALSTSTGDSALEKAVKHARAAGALIVAAVGNANDPGAARGSERYPAAYDGVLGVAALTISGQPSPDSVSGPHVDLAAPGQDVLSTFLSAGDCRFATDKASTSYATAYVAAIAALVAARYPKETADEWAYRLMVTASRPVAQSRDDQIGWGIVSPTAALTFIDDGLAAGPIDAHHSGPVLPGLTPSVPTRSQPAVLPTSVKAIAAGGFLLGLAVLAAGWLIVRLPGRSRSGRRPTSGARHRA